MKLTNFYPLDENGNHEFAQVTVTTGALFWKKIERRTICKRRPGAFWFFVDTGEFTPGDQAEAAERAYYARENMPIL